METSIWAGEEKENANHTTQIAPIPPTDSSLSAEATTFEPPTDVPSLETFAQTGAPEEDLFAEDFTPASQPTVEKAAPQSIPAPQPARTTGEAPPTRARGRGRGRGRGSYEERIQNRGDNHAQSRGSHNAGHSSDSRSEATQVRKTAPPPENAPTGPRKEGPTSVRGDRHATGGVRKPKLTEDELAAKMAKIQIKNADLTAAHARAEADAASFAHREQQAKHVAEQRKKEERRDRQQMMGEREKNRLRKLKAMEGREWDAEKQEDDFRAGARHDKKGGFAGDKGDYSDGREYLLREPRGGERGRGGGRGGAQGRHEGRLSEVPKPDDFPSLPAATKSDATTAEKAEVFSNSSKPSGKSWADQVEGS